MPAYDFSSPRLYVDTPLAAGGSVELDAGQAHYLLNVLRLKADDTVLLFNGRDGEWRGEVAPAGKRKAGVRLAGQTRTQPAPRDLHYLFAPLKHARLDYVVQKAVEMGVSRLQPVLTRHTHVSRLNLERMRANAIEAAEQCGILSLAEIAEPAPLADAVRRLEADRLLVFCDERADVQDPIAALSAWKKQPDAPPKLAVLIGPEGGFGEDERTLLERHPAVVRLALGPRILRADTAAVAALALVQASLGDWT